MSLIKNLTFQVLFCVLAGVGLGYFYPEQAMLMKPMSDLFFKIVKMLVPLIVFFSVVNGIGGIGSMKRLGSLGGRALIYFEVVTTLALIIGLFIGNWIEPGAGIDFSGIKKEALPNTIDTTKKGIDWVAFLMHMIPGNAVNAFAEGDVIQVLVFAILFGIGVLQLGSSATSLLRAFDTIMHVLFQILGLLMKFAPIAAFAAMAFAIGKFGVQSLIPLGKIMISFYATALVFIVGVLGLIARYTGFSLFKYLKYIKDEILIVLGTCSSETVLNRMMHKMEQAGCAPSVVRFVLPAGYSFNLDGSTIYLSMGTLFLAQAFNVPLSWQQQLSVVFILMVTSKGAAAVHGSAIVVLASTMAALEIVPVEGVAILLGVDRFMSEARSVTNLIGNGIATLYLSKVEGQLDQERLKQVIGN